MDLVSNLFVAKICGKNRQKKSYFAQKSRKVFKMGEISDLERFWRAGDGGRGTGVALTTQHTERRKR